MNVIARTADGGRSLILLVSLAILALGAAWSPSAAHATNLTSCTGTENVTFSPGELLLTTRSIHVTYLNNYSCNSTDPLITGATIGGAYNSDLSCTSPATITSGTHGRIHWNTGETSFTTVTERSNSVVAGQAVDTIISTIDSGKFAGATSVATVTNIAPNLLDCLSEPGLTSKQGLVTTTITG